MLPSPWKHQQATPTFPRPLSSSLSHTQRSMADPITSWYCHHYAGTSQAFHFLFLNTVKSKFLSGMKKTIFTSSRLIAMHTFPPLISTHAYTCCNISYVNYKHIPETHTLSTLRTPVIIYSPRYHSKPVTFFFLLLLRNIKEFLKTFSCSYSLWRLEPPSSKKDHERIIKAVNSIYALETDQNWFQYITWLDHWQIT